MKRKLITLLLSLLVAAPFAAAQNKDIEAEFFSLPDTLTNEYLDSLKLTVAPANDYWMIGAFGGVTANYGYFNPTRYVRWQLQYPLYGISVVRYFTMFGIFHNMGCEFGFQQNYEGYEFKPTGEAGKRPTESGAYKIYMKVPEVFFLSHFHVDVGEHFKFIGKLGLYGGYRLSIHRVLEEGYDTIDTYVYYQDKFRDYDRRFTYGIQLNLGAGVVFSPVEFHLTVGGKWGWGSFWNPDYASKYYYRFGYPLDATLSLGAYFHLTPRYGHSRAQLRKLAKRMAQEQLERQQQLIKQP